MSDAGDDAGYSLQDDEPIPYKPRGQTASAIPPHHSTANGSPAPTHPSPRLDLLATNNNPQVETPGRPRASSLTATDVSTWWGNRDNARPWVGLNVLERKKTAPPEQQERMKQTKLRVDLALRSTLGYALDATHDALEAGANLLRFAPVPGLDEAAHVLLSIWNALQLVETNKLACTRLTERCAEILLAVREEIHEAGDQVGDELAGPLDKLTSSFRSVHILLQKQVHRPFLKRYLKRDEILRNIGGCDAELSDALGLFALSIQVRTLRQILAADAQRRAETDRLLQALLPGYVSPDTTPRPGNVELPPESTETAPPTYEQTPSTATSATTASSDSTPKEPPPTPKELMLLPESPSPQDIHAQLLEIALRQNELDHELDMRELHSIMRAALATSNDVDMIKVLQVQREEMPEAIKTLQRALEQCLEQERQGEDVKSALEEAGNESPQARAATPTTSGVSRVATASAVKLGAEDKPSQKPGPMAALRRKLTIEGPKAKNGKKKGPKGKGKARQFTGDTLDKEFIESGIDALRRLSAGQEINLPPWTITRYEVDLDEKIGFGFFSDVYKATWRHTTVAVKVLARTTPKRLFVHEMHVWKKLNHPNVLPLLGASSARGDPPWFFVSPYMKFGNMITYLKASHRSRDVQVHKRMIYEVAKGMEYLHKQGIMHGDLKGTNVLIDDDRHCVLADFGQSEMKSEAYRISGTAPPRGALRWQAPELLDGLAPGRLTQQVDVYAFAIVCIEILGQGALPWPMLEDETVRALVLRDDKRPPIPGVPVPEIAKVIEVSWKREASSRPSFTVVVRELKKAGVAREAESPAPSHRNLWEDSHHRPSPDMRPVPLPFAPVNQPSVQESSNSTNTSGLTANSYHTAASTIIPVQRIITPIREDERQVSPVEYRPIGMPVPEPYVPLGHSGMSSPVSAGGGLLFVSTGESLNVVTATATVPATRFYEIVGPDLRHVANLEEAHKVKLRHVASSEADVEVLIEGQTANVESAKAELERHTAADKAHIRASTVDERPQSEPTGSNAKRSDTVSTSTTTGSSGATTSSESKNPSELEKRAPGVDIARFDSPPPADEIIAMRKNESRYRLTLQHDHDLNRSLILALWDPTPVQLGAVGYLLKPYGRFTTLFNAFEPLQSSGGRTRGMPSLYGYGKVTKGDQRQDRRNMAQRGLDIIQGLLWFKTRSDGAFQRSVSRRYSYPLHAGQKCAYLCTGTTIYRYITELLTPKAWFAANIDRILEIYGKEHRLQKEDVYLVMGTLDAQDYGLFVNHNHPDGQVHFNVYTSPKVGQEWGVFSTDTEVPPSAAGGPDYHEEVKGKSRSASKVSIVKPDRPWDTVLIARLRFKPDSDSPTSL